MRGEITESERLEALHAVLRVVVRHPNVLSKAAFEELAAVIGEHIETTGLLVLVPEGPDKKRIFSLIGRGGVVEFGALIPSPPGEVDEAVYGRLEPFIRDDMREGGELEKAAAAVGTFSYITVPICPRERGEARVARGEMVFTFAEVGAARRLPLELFTGIAEILASSFERARTQARERRLAMILETSGDAMLAWDREGRITDVNAAATALTGRAREALIGARIADVLDPPPVAPLGPAEPNRMVLRALAPDGGERQVVVAASLTAVDDDPMVASHALLRDLSRVVEAERQAELGLARVRELEEQHRTLLDNAPVIIYRLDPATDELVYLNRHAERLLGVPTHEALATPGFLRQAHADPEGAAQFDHALHGARTGAPSVAYVARLRRRGAEAISARGIVYPLLNAKGDLVAIEGVLADVSAEQAARTRLVQSDRLATLGTLAAGVAHEINNPAAFILLGLDMLDRLLRGPGVTLEGKVAEQSHGLLNELRDSIRRIVDIARDLRLFASPPTADAGRRTVIDVNRTVESALNLTRGQILERAQIARHLEDVPSIVMEDGRLGQVIVNLLVNAAQAIPKTYERDHRVTVGTRSDGRHVLIEVTDTGVGISPENLARIWQPFFTTKAAEAGTGLGLSISREIIERAGGTIRVESPAVFEATTSSRGAVGSRFTITLPVSSRTEAITPISSPLPRIPSERARVLIVEDEASLARALSLELGAFHVVKTAAGAEEALGILARETFDVVLCDLRMPGMSGEAFYDEVLRRDPAIATRFCFMTGVGFGAEVERFLAASGRPVLEKPFSAEEALDVILKVMARAKKADGARSPSSSSA